MKLHIKGLWAVAAVTGSALLFSCSNDDVDITNPSAPVDYVCFRLDQGQNADGTRSDGKQYVLRAAGTADTLCMRTEITDGISTGTAATRGTQITGAADLTGFDCYAYINEDGKDKFYIDGEQYDRIGNVYRADNTYYWPQRDMDFGFYAVFPSAAKGLMAPTPDYMMLQYTVPANVAEQQDLMLATSNVQHKAGDKHAPVPLTFKHLLSAVKIKAGKTMPAGTLKSVTFENVYASAEYDLAGGAWTDCGNAGSFTVTPNLAVDGSEGQELLGGDNTLLMLPQQLAASGSKAAVRMTVVFDDAVRGEMTLTAELSGEWLMGQTHTYVLSITPEYTLDFTTDTPAYADAHYNIVKVCIVSSGLGRDGGWTLEIKDGPASAMLKSDLTPFEESGYWLEDDDNYKDYCKSVGKPSLRSRKITGKDAAAAVYLYLEENAGDTDQTITLELYPTKYPNTEHRRWTITQHHPNWDANGIGWECIEEAVDGSKVFPYGFKWDRKVTYQIRIGFLGLFAWFEELYVKELIDKDYVTIKGPGVFNPYVTVTIDYTKVNNCANMLDASNGLQNTWNLFSEAGGSGFNIEDVLVDRGYSVTEESGSLKQMGDYAALCAMKKNKFRIGLVTKDDKTDYVVTIGESDVKWYLPASGQFSTVGGLTFGSGCTDMTGGDFWSSTAVNDNANAKSWNGAAYTSDRMQNKRVRAVRKRN